MDEPARTAAYRKDPGQEALLRVLNERLLGLQLEIEAQTTAPTLPIVFIVGPPRSGTTLVSQVLAYSGAFAYVSNFVARFWLAPAVGAQIEQALDVRKQEPLQPFASEYGVTQGWSAPHEFGYFWSHWFDRGQDTHKLGPDELGTVDAATLIRRVASIERTYAAPLTFKNNTWCTFQAAWLAKQFPTAIFLACRREPLFVAQSLMLARRARFGNDANWWSVRPSSYARLRDLPVWDQVARQALEIEREMDEALGEVPTARKLEVSYTDFCAHPGKFFDDLVNRLRRDGTELGEHRRLPGRFEVTNAQRLPADEWDRLKSAIKRAQASGPSA